MSFDEASKAYKKQFYAGRKSKVSQDGYKFPYSRARYSKEDFIEVEFPVNCISTRVRKKDLVPQYANDIKWGDEFPAVWLSIGRKLRSGEIILHHDRKIRVMDGFHRITATQSLNRKTIKACMPKSHYEYFKNNLEVKGNELYNKNKK